MQVSNKIPALNQHARFMGKINPIRPIVVKKSEQEFNNIVQSSNLSPAYFHPNLRPSFTGKAELIKEFDSLLGFAIENPTKINDKIKAKLTSLFYETAEASIANFINGGRDSNVFRYSDNYVLKLPASAGAIKGENFSTISNRYNKELSAYYGEELAEIGNARFLKNADPNREAISIGAPYDLGQDHKKVNRYYSEKDFPTKIAKMPQEAFDEIAGNFKILNNMEVSGYKPGFDFFNPNNVLIVGNKFKITDVLCFTRMKNYNNIDKILDVFLVKGNTYEMNDFNKEFVPQRKEIFKKCILANEKHELPLCKDTEAGESLFHSLRLTDINLKEKTIVARLNRFRKEIPNLDERLEALGKYLDNLG